MATTNYAAPYLQDLESSITDLERANQNLRTGDKAHVRSTRDLLSAIYAAEDEIKGWSDHARTQRERIIQLQRYNLILRWATLGLSVIAAALGWKR